VAMSFLEESFTRAVPSLKYAVVGAARGTTPELSTGVAQRNPLQGNGLRSAVGKGCRCAPHQI
jgi:hypothetical protein